VDQLFHLVQTKETNYKNVFLQPDHVPSTTVALHGRNCNNFVAVHADVFEILVSWAEKFSATFFSTLTFEVQLH